MASDTFTGNEVLVEAGFDKESGGSSRRDSAATILGVLHKNF